MIFHIGTNLHCYLKAINTSVVIYLLRGNEARIPNDFTIYEHFHVL